MLPLKDKTGKSVADAFKEIFKKSKRKPEKLWTDKGREFYNKHVKELGVELYSIENEEKSSVVERWNRTMKKKCSSISQQTIPTNILTFLTTLLRDTTTPVEASKKTNAVTVYKNLYPDLTRRPMRAKFKIGDKVRIQKKKGFLKRVSSQTGQKSSPFQKFKEPIR